MIAAGLSDRLSAHIAQFETDALPPSAALAAKRVLLDAAGVTMAASGLAPEVQPFIALARQSGAGPATILGTGFTASAQMAAFANGAMAHALDFEDTFDLAPGHPNASLAPALIALAQADGPIDGRRFLAALALGGDLSCRIGLSVGHPLENGGWYPPPIVAAFGAAAGAARLLGLDAAGVRDALSLMLCQVTMPGEIKHSARTQLRAVREAFPAQAAVNAALLARAGVAGFEQPLEGREGFYALFARGMFSTEVLLDRLGDRFWIEELTFKPWPTCRGTHACLELALRLRNDHAIDPSAVARIVVGHDDAQRMLVDPPARKRAPQTLIDAKFSIPFVTALALVRGRVGLDDFTSATLEDPAILALADKVEAEFRGSEAWQRGAGGALRIELHGGQAFEASIGRACGAPERPLTDEQRVQKFVECTAKASRPQPAAAARAMADAILNLDQLDDVGALFRSK
ncbi:MAG TPA: MmgE/PrpD family protein [Croceibacterium sp.]|nr:MmgE/PrpD family protein [Croceibacterium sp.]